MNGFKKTVIVATAALVLGFGVTAQAVMINGGVGLNGEYVPGPDPTDTDLDNATSISMLNTNVQTDSGDFETVFDMVNTGAVVHSDFVFDPITTPVAGLWSWTNGVDVVSFNLVTMSVDFRNSNVIVFSGTGTINATGFDTTDADWQFTANSTQGQQGEFTFSTSQSTVNPVPEPGTMMLMGSGLLGLGLWRKFKK